jgi:hypothetical protein
VKAEAATQASVKSGADQRRVSDLWGPEGFSSGRWLPSCDRDEVVERNRKELREELETFHEQLKQGVHVAGGLLGRAAEFLVGQKGL